MNETPLTGRLYFDPSSDQEAITEFVRECPAKELTVEWTGVHDTRVTPNTAILVIDGGLLASPAEG